MERLDDYEKCTILYVDDEQKSLKYFTRAFKEKFRILTAANAAEGYQILEQHRDEIALLMIDQRMPGEKGVEFLQRARRLHPLAIRILTTAYSDFDVVVEAINSGAISKCVTKPWDIAELEMVLQRCCDFFREQRERDPVHSAKPQMPVTDRSGESGDLQTVEQVARYLNVNKFTIYRLVVQKKIPAFKVGNQWRFKQELIDAWLAAQSSRGQKKSN